MQKKQKKIHGFLSLLMTFALLAGMLPTLTIQAAAANCSCDLYYGSVTIDASAGTVSYSDSSGAQSATIDSSTEVVITQTDYATASTSNYITVTGSGTVNITINGVNIGPSGGCIMIGNDSVTVNLTLEGTNTLTGNNDSGIVVPVNATLNIDGSGSVTVTLTRVNKNIPGIGSYTYGTGTINIKNGTVNATGSVYSAGIGGGYEKSGGTVNISGGKVTASGYSSGYGAGIGGGYGGSGSKVNISGGTVIATGGNGNGVSGGTGIGGGYLGSGDTLTISGGTVSAYGGSSSAGIGGGFYSAGGTITISGGTVTATGGSDSAGIGGGYNGDGGTVYISGGSVKATGDSGAESIGKGYRGTSSGTLQNNITDKANVYLTTVTAASILSKDVAYTTDGGASQSLCSTDLSGKLYLWLTVSSSTTVDVSAVGSTTYYEGSGSVAASNLNTITCSSSGTISELTLTATNESDTITYDGNSHVGYTVSVSGATHPCSVIATYYSGDSSSGTALSGAPTNAGNYTVVFSLSSFYYYASDVTEMFTITPVSATISASAAGWTYDGSSHAGYSASLLNTAGNAVSTSLYTLTPTYYSGSDITATPLSGTPTDAGDYTVELSLSNTNFTVSSVSVSFTILKQTATISATAASCTYDGSSHDGYTLTGVTNASSATLDSSLYAVTSKYYSGSSASGTLLSGTPTDAGIYTVVLSLSSTNYTAASVSVSFTILKQTATISATAASCTYDGSSHDGYTLTGVTNASGATFDSSLYTLTPTYYSGTGTSGTELGAAPANAGTYTVELSLSSTNYIAEAQLVTFTIGQYTPTVTLSAISSPATGGVEVTLTATVSKASSGTYPSGDVIFKAGGNQISTGSLTNGQAQYIWTTTSTGTFDLTAEYGDGEDTNYAAASYTLSGYDVSKYSQAALTIGGVPGSITYGDSAFTLTASGGSGNGAVSWTSSDTSVASVDSNTGEVTVSGAGSCDITSTKAADNAYNEASAKTTITVSKQTATISALAVNCTYDGVSHAGYTLTDVKGAADATLDSSLYAVTSKYYFGSSASGTLLSGTPTDAGIYTVVLSLSSTNYTASLTVNFTIDKYQPTISTLPTASSISSGSTLSASTLTGGAVKGVNGETVSGTFAWTDGTVTVSAAGSYSVTFTPDSANYASALADVAVSLISSGGSSSESSGGSTTTYNYTTSSSNGLTTTTTTVTAALGSDGTSAASVPSKQLTEGINEAEEADEENKRIEISVSAPDGATGVSLTIPRSAFDTLADNTIGSLRLTTSSGTVTFDSTAIDAINSNASGDITITIKEADISALSDENKDKIGGRPVYDLTVTSGSTTVSSFGGGTATVSVPYTPVAGENVNAIVVYYINASGELVTVPTCVYDAKTGTVTFTTTHFSTYAVGYNNMSFTDVADSAWYADYVAYLAAKGIIGGNNGAFSPDASITRAEFVTILARMSDDDLSGHTTSSFSDVSTDSWYFAAVQWANKAGIASGYDGKFSPNASITREQMAAMLYRYAEYKGTVSNTEGMSVREFSDYASISSWAQAPIQWAMNNGILSGNGDGSFAPQSSATRAEAAKMLAILLNGMIGS